MQTSSSHTSRATPEWHPAPSPGALMTAMVLLLAAACATPVEVQPIDGDLRPAAYRDGGKATAGADRKAEAPPEFAGQVDGYVDFALRNHPDLLSEYETWRARKASVEAAYTWPEPTISYGFFIRPVETRVGPQRHRLGIKQPLPWPSKPAAASRAQAAEANVQKHRYGAAMLTVRRQVIQRYWRRWMLGRKIYWERQQILLLESLQEAARARAEVGKTPQSDLHQLALEVSRRHDRVEQLEREQRALRARFLDDLGLSNADRLDELPVEPARLPGATVPEDDSETLVERARSHPRVLALQEAVEAAERSAERASLEKMPDFTVGFDWVETGPARMDGVADSGKDPLMAMVAVKIPLWFNQYNARTHSDEARGRARRAEIRSARNQLAARTRSTLERIRDAARRIELYRNTLLPQAEATYESTLGRYEVEQAGIASLLLAQRDLLELRLELAEARADHARRWATLEQLVGQPVEPRRDGQKP